VGLIGVSNIDEVGFIVIEGKLVQLMGDGFNRWLRHSEDGFNGFKR
jgi:hypothetical protein